MRPLSVLIAWFFICAEVLANKTANFSAEGVVTAASCSVVLGIGGLVTLPLQRTATLSSAGLVAGKTRFRISIENCTADNFLYFQNDQETVNSAGRLINTAHSETQIGAENVELQLLNADSSPVDLTAEAGLQNIGAATPGNSKGTYDFDLFVQYYSTGVATSGEVGSSLTFLVESF